MTDFWYNFWYMVAGASLGALIGGAISLAVTAYYVRQGSQELQHAAKELRRETEDVKHYINALISYLEAAGAIRVVRDDNGRPIETQIIKLSALVVDTSSATTTQTVTRQDEGRRAKEDAPGPGQ